MAKHDNNCYKMLCFSMCQTKMYYTKCLFDENATKNITKCHILVWQGVENKKVLIKMSMWRKYDKNCYTILPFSMTRCGKPKCVI